MSGLLSASPVDVQEAHEYNRAIQVCNTDFYWTLVTSSYCVSYRRLAIKYKTTSDLLYHAVQKVASDELEISVIMRCLESVLFVYSSLFTIHDRSKMITLISLCLFYVSILNCIRYQCFTLIIYHVVVNIITIVRIS